MSRRNRCAVGLVMWMVALCASRFLGGSQTVADDGPSSRATFVRSTLEGMKLRLTNSKDSAAERFSFVVEVFVARGGRRVKQYDVYVCRDGDKSAALVRYPDGLPYAYFSEGFAVICDTAGKRLMFSDGGHLRFRFERREQIFCFEIAFVDQIEDAGIVVDPVSVADTADGTRGATFDAMTRTLHITTENTQIEMQLSSASDPAYELRQISICRDTLTIALKNVCTAAAPAPDILGISRADFEKLGLPLVRNTQKPKKLSPFPPAMSPLDAERREVVMKFASVFGLSTELPANADPSRKSLFIQSLVKDKRLELSSLPTSASDIFAFTFDVSQVQQGKEVKMFNVYISRKKDRAAALVRYPDGLPYAYIADGLLVICDAQQRRFLLNDNGYLRFRFLRKGGLRFVLEFARERADAGIFVDPQSIVDPGEQTQTVSFDSFTKSLHVTANEVSIDASFRLPSGKPGYDIDAVVIDRKGTILALRHVVANTEAPVDIQNLDRKAIEDLGESIVRLSHDDSVQAVPGGGCLQDPKQREFAKRFGTLFRE